MAIKKRETTRNSSKENKRDSKRAVYWLKRDFRLKDNPAWRRAIEENDEVLPVFIFEPSLLNAQETSNFHIHAWWQALEYLQEEVKKLNGDILIMRGEVIELLNQIHQTFTFKKLYSHQETGSAITFERDKTVHKWCKNNNIEWIEELQQGVFRALHNRDKRKKLWNAFISKPLEQEITNVKFPDDLKHFVAKYSESTFKRLNVKLNSNLQVVTQRAAHSILNSFLSNRGEFYSGNISSPNTAFEFGSRLSVHLAWGTISERYVLKRIKEKKLELKQSNKSSKKWSRSLTAVSARLSWRDHFIQKLETEPEIEFYPQNKAFELVTYENSKQKLQRWLSGTTGFPIIDACMLCLNKTGFLNFRMRAMVVSFACFYLGLDWRKIMYPLAQLFYDYEPGIHIS